MEDTVQKEAEKKVINRRKYRKDEWTDEMVAARKAELTVTEVPAGYVKISELGKMCNINNIPISLLVKATGGDRGMDEPLDPLFQIVYVGRTRYVKPETMTAGIELLQSEGFGKTPRKPRAKKEKAEGAEGAKPAKKAKVNVSVAATPVGRDANPHVWEPK